MSVDHINSLADQWCILTGHIAWQAGIVGVLALLFVRLGWRLSSPLRYGILLLALLKFVIPPMLGAPTGVFGLVQVPSRTQPAVESAKRAYGDSSERSPDVPRIRDAPIPPSEAIANSTSNNKVTVDSKPHAGPGMMDLIGETSVPSPTKAPEASVAQSETPLTWWAVMMIVHLVGALVGLFAIAVRIASLRRSIRRMRVPSDHMQKLFEECVERIGLRRAPNLRVAQRESPPFSFGLLRPTVVVSEAQAQAFDDSELQTVFMHELTHHRRFDLWLVTIQSVLAALWWFHPVAWLLNREIRIVREDCCDDSLLRRGYVSNDGYCATLLRVASLQATRLPRGVAVTMAGPNQSLSARFRRIMDDQLLRAERTTWLAAAALTLLGLIVLPGMSTTTNDDAPPESTESTDVQRHDPAKKTELATPPAAEREKPWPEFVNVRVLDPNGMPIENARVERELKRKTVEFFTDADGRAKIPTGGASESNWLVIRANAEPYVQFYSLFGRAPKKDEYVFRLENGQTVGGRVVDPAGRPVADARITVKFNPNNEDRSWPRPDYAEYTTRTNEAGEWQQGQIPKNLHSIRPMVYSKDFISDAGEEPFAEPVSIEELVAKSHVRTVRKGVTFRGRVIDEDGEPIEGVRLRLADGAYPDHADMPVTDAEGNFEFKHCGKVKSILLANKSGFAPFAKLVEIDNADIAVECQLDTGREVRVRVADNMGQPIRNHVLYVRKFGVWPSEFPRAFGCWFHAFNDESPRTNAQGVWTWPNAPRARFNVDAANSRKWQRPPKLTVEEDMDEIAFTLNPILKVNGTVVDDATNVPVKSFDVIPRGSSELSWDHYSRTTGKDGRFEKKLNGMPREWHKVRIEADGYMPVESRPIKDDEGTISLEFRMKRPERRMIMRVVGQDDKPEANARVIVATSTARAYIRQDLQSGLGGSGARTFETDATGKLELRPQQGPFTAYVVGKSGFAHINQRTFQLGEDEVEVRTVPWGRVEGVARRNGKLLKNYPVSLDFPLRGGWRDFARFDFGTKTDKEGRFVFDRVPPESSIEVTLRKEIRDGMFLTRKPEARAQLYLSAGQHEKLTLGGFGVSVSGRVDFKGDANVDWENSDLFLEHRDREHSRNVRYLPTYAHQMDADGSFRCEEIPPGAYELRIRIFRKTDNATDNGDQKRELLGRRHQTIEIKDANVDLGELVIYPVARYSKPSNAKSAPKTDIAAGASIRVRRRVTNESQQPVANALATMWYVDEAAKRLQVTTSQNGTLSFDDVPAHGGWLFIKASGYRMHGEYVDAKSALQPILLTSTDSVSEATSHEWPAVSPETLDLLQRGLVELATASKDSLVQNLKFELQRVLAEYGPPEFALKYLESHPVDFSGMTSEPETFAAWHAGVVKSFAAESLAVSDASKAQAVIESIPNPNNRFTAYTRAAARCQKTNKAKALEWMQAALDDARRPGDGKSRTRAWRLNHVAERYDKLGEEKLALKVLRLALQAARNSSTHERARSSRMSVAVQMASWDPQAALSLLDDFPSLEELSTLIDQLSGSPTHQQPDSGHIPNWQTLITIQQTGRVAQRVAAKNPKLAETILGRLGRMKDEYAVPVCYEIAKSNPAAARRLADAISTVRYRGHAYGVIADASPQDPAASEVLARAFDLLEESVDAAEKNSAALRVALSLMPTIERVDPGLVPEYLWRTLSFRCGNTVGISRVKPLETDAATRRTADPGIAAFISRYDPGVAHQLAFARGDTTLNLSFREAPFFLLGALATIHPEQAVNAILAMPHTSDEERLVKLAAFKQVLPVLAKNGEERWNSLVDDLLSVWRPGKS